ncbi:MAG: hypothetical protein ACKVTZ_15120 [Bacteroidia bacterium]
MMINNFKDDFFLMLKQTLGYNNWVKKHPYRIDRLIFGECDFHHRHRDNHHRQLIRKILEEKVCENEIIDLFFKSLIRAEIRFSSRFIPQRSNEERLTGHLISEIGGAIELIKPIFEQTSLSIYSEKKTIDFFYFDLSKGGKLEKQTGADLAITIAIDLPDFPKTFKTIVFQAKKIHNSTSLDLVQYETLVEHNQGASAYLFYDTDLQTLSSPFVVMTNNISSIYKKAVEENNKSFTVTNDTVLNGLPLSAFLCFELIVDEHIGVKHRTFEEAINYAQQFEYDNDNNFTGYLGVVSIGRKLKYEINSNNEGYNLTME